MKHEQLGEHEAIRIELSRRWPNRNNPLQIGELTGNRAGRDGSG
jgi:hypothetical protein